MLEASGKSEKQLLPMLLALAIFCSASIGYAIRSPGFLETDSLTHYLYARFALTERHYLVNIWGRPLVTGLYAVPAALGGRLGVRLTSLVLALACGFIAYAIARGQKYRLPGLALLFTLAQPLVFLHSFSELTELPFAALLGMAFLAYQRRQFLVMTALIGLSPLARPEGFGFIVLAALALIAHRRARWIPLLIVPLALWDFAGWKMFGSPQYQTNLPRPLHWVLWLKQNWPYAPTSLYDSGSIFHFLLLMPAVMSPLIFPALCVGVARAFARDISSGTDWKPVLRVDCLIALIPLLILVGHSILYAAGKMASSGEMRYMAVVAPFWGILAARGWGWTFERLKWRHPFLWACLFAAAPAFVNWQPQIAGRLIGYRVLPLTLQQDMVIANRVAGLYRATDRSILYPHLLAAHPGVYYFLDRSPTSGLNSPQWNKQTIAEPLPGIMLVWDPVYGVYNSDANRSVKESDIEAAGWMLDEELTDTINDEDMDDAERWSVWVSPG
jgi:hypothetical protein